MYVCRLSLLALLLFPGYVLAQSSAPGVPVSTVITAESKHKADPPSLTKSDVIVHQDKERAQVEDLTAYGTDGAGLQLILALDDSSGQASLGIQIQELKKWISSLPAQAQIAVGYMRNGSLRKTSEFTTDHARAAESVRLPLGEAGANGSPYVTLSDLAKHWPSSDQGKRREIVLITNGVDPYYPGYNPQNPYLQSAIEDSQRAGIIVFSIYLRGGGPSGGGVATADIGQNYLTQLSDATGGNLYYQGFGNPVSVKPFLEDIDDRLSHQYRLTFLARPENKATLQQIKVEAETSGVKLKIPSKVPVPAGL